MSDRFEETKAMMSVPTIMTIVEILEQKYGLGSAGFDEIAGSYVGKGALSNEAVDLILLAIEDDLPDVTFEDIADNEAGIIPFYVKKLGITMDDLRSRYRRD